VRRVTVLPAKGENCQPLEIEAGSSMNAQLADQYCEVGCGGPQQPVQYLPRMGFPA